MKTKMLAVSILGFLTYSASAYSHSQVSSVMANGSACPMNDPKLSIKGNVISIETDDVLSNLRGGARFDRKNCQITLDIVPHSGWYYELEQVKLEGLVELSKGAKGQARLAVYHQGAVNDQSATIAFEGGTKETFTLKNKGMIKSSCDDARALNINTSTRILSGKSKVGRGVLVLKGKLKLRLNWKRCD